MKKKIISLLYTFVAMLYTIPTLANSTQTVQGYFQTAGVTQKDPGTVAANIVKISLHPLLQ